MENVPPAAKTLFIKRVLESQKLYRIGIITFITKNIPVSHETGMFLFKPTKPSLIQMIKP